MQRGRDCRLGENARKIEYPARLNGPIEAAQAIRREFAPLAALEGEHRPALLIILPVVGHGLACPGEGEIVGGVLHGARVAQQRAAEEAQKGHAQRQDSRFYPHSLHENFPPAMLSCL